MEGVREVELQLARLSFGPSLLSLDKKPLDWEVLPGTVARDPVVVFRLRTRSPDRSTGDTIYSAGPWCTVPLPVLPDRVHRLAFWLLQYTTSHELAESVYRDGVLLNDPHK